jgi:hypothetical protein
MMRKLHALWVWVEDTRCADAVGVAVLFGSLWLALWVLP